MNFWIIYLSTLLHLNFVMNRPALPYELYNLTENTMCLAGYISTIVKQVQPYTTILDLSTFNNSNDAITSSIVKESSYIIRRNEKPAKRQLTSLTLVILWHTIEGCPSTQEIQILSNKIKYVNYERPRVPVILILQSKVICKNMADLLQELQGPRVYRVVILTLSLVNGCHVSLHTYDYFTRTYSIFPEINNVTVFPNKLRKFNGFKMKVAIAKNPPNVYLDRDMKTGEPRNMDGFEIKILKIIAKQLDLNMEFVPRFNEMFNAKFSNGTPTGIVVELFEHKHDLTGNSIYIYTYNDRFVQFAELSRPFDYVSLCVVILSNGGMSVVNSFVGVKELTIVCCCVLTVVWFGLSVVPKNHPVRGVLKTIGSLLGSGVPLFPKRWSARLFLISLTVLFGTMSTKLQSLLTSSLIYEFVPNDIKTLRELESTGCTILIGEGHYNMSLNNLDDENNENHYYRRLRDRSKLFESTALCIQRIVQRREKANIACVIESRIAISFMKEFRELVMVKECLMTYWKGFALFRGYHAFPMFNKVLAILTNGGIVNKIVRDTVGVGHKDRVKNIMRNLNLNNFYTTIYVIIILYAISLTVFLIELLIGRYKKN